MMGFPANEPDGHQLVNKSDGDVLYLEVGDRSGGDALRQPPRTDPKAQELLSEIRDTLLRIEQTIKKDRGN